MRRQEGIFWGEGWAEGSTVAGREQEEGLGAEPMPDPSPVLWTAEKFICSNLCCRGGADPSRFTAAALPQDINCLIYSSKSTCCILCWGAIRLPGNKHRKKSVH